ncbi:hypothetical protein [Fibrobacter succinogenes]|uniref:hypothetical protein n=1 Tax=Fibrobacter succinogenes TaxID=833 RepID=UPI001563823D|nr:hypothetical protein [Fibrobacter succinogenes]
MKKIMFLTVCFAVVFFACSDSPQWVGTTENENTVHAAQDDTTHQNVKEPSLRLGECEASPFQEMLEWRGQALAKSASEELPKAYIVQDSAGNDQIMVPLVNDYCGVEVKLAYELSGDTLTVSYDEIIMATKCVCYSDHWFDLPAEYKDAKYFRFEEITYEIVHSKKEGSL